MVRAWVKLIWNSLGVAAVAAAAQMGVAQAVGIIRWSDGGGDANGWVALLTWVGFIYAVSVLGGAAVGRRALRRPNRRDGAGVRFVAALCASLGAAVAVAVAYLPAQTANSPVNVDPELVVAMTAAAGIIVGVVAALVALSVPAFAGGARAAVAWIWLVGLGSAVAGQVTHQPFRAPRLAVIDPPSLVPVAWWSGPSVMIAATAVLGLAVAIVARWGGAHRVGVALSGIAGPALVAAAYLIAGPGTGSDRAPALEPYTASLIAVGAGLIASVVVALPGRRTKDRPDRQAQVAAAQPVFVEEPEYDDNTYDYVEPPAPALVPAQGLMGQPQNSFEEDYSDWLRDLGHEPGHEPGQHPTDEPLRR